MSNTKKKYLKIVGGCVLAYLLIILPWSTGTVIEKATGNPIAGAVVSVTWRGHIAMPVQGKSLCYETETTTTNKNGRYWIPIFSGNLDPFIGSRIRIVDVLAPGFRQLAYPEKDALTFSMVRREGTPSEQFADVNRRSVPSGCRGGKKALPYMKAWHQELAKLAATKEEFERVEGALWSIEEIEFGQEIADKNRVERRQVRMRGEKTEK